MPMPPEDIIVGLQTLASSDQMNARQREVMIEAAGMIKFQQHRVTEAERKQKYAEDAWDKISEENKGLRARLAALMALDEYRRKHLIDLANTKEYGEQSAMPQNPAPASVIPKPQPHNHPTTIMIETT